MISKPRRQEVLLKLHGDKGDWRQVVLTALSYQRFQDSYPLLAQQLDQALRWHPVVFVGCSLRDPRVLGWLRGLSAQGQAELFASRVLIAHGDWQQIPAADQELLRACKVHVRRRLQAVDRGRAALTVRADALLQHWSSAPRPRTAPGVAAGCPPRRAAPATYETALPALFPSPG